MAVQGLPSRVGINLSNWNWKAGRRFVVDRFGLVLSRSPPVADLNYLHQLRVVSRQVSVFEVKPFLGDCQDL